MKTFSDSGIAYVSAAERATLNILTLYTVACSHQGIRMQYKVTLIKIDTQSERIQKEGANC